MVFFRMRAYNDCGGKSRYSKPVWYQKVGNAWQLFNQTEESWSGIKALKCQSDSGERPLNGDKRLEALKLVA